MMKYMLLMYGTENNWTEEERTACMIKSMSVIDELAAQGKFVEASPPGPVATARTVRFRDGKSLVTEGPFAETNEQLGGYYVLDLEHLDEAIAVATRLPPATKGTVEIRPIRPVEGSPPSRSLPAERSNTPAAAYMPLFYRDEAAWQKASPEALKTALVEARNLAHDLNDSGRYVNAAPLHPAESATCVRVRDAKRTITDGPSAETTEVLGGYYVILAENSEDAVRIAECHPGARFGSVEVRPLFDLSVLKGSVRK